MNEEQQKSHIATLDQAATDGAELIMRGQISLEDYTVRIAERLCMQTIQFGDMNIQPALASARYIKATIMKILDTEAEQRSMRQTISQPALEPHPEQPEQTTPSEP